MSNGNRHRLRLALAQVNPTVGDIEGNRDLVATQISAARDAGAQLVVLPELVISGYPPEDLVLKRDFLDACREALDSLVGESEGIVALVGFPERDGYVHNSAAVLAGGKLHGIYRKMLLPNYGVFDERRYFEPGDTPAVIDVGGVVVGLTICEDIWFAGPPSSAEAMAGASLIVNPSGSPYHHGKGAEREQQIAAARARETGAFFALCNTVGGQDELVFDGQSFVVDGEGNTIARAAQFAEELLVCELELPAREREDDPPRSSPARLLASIELSEPVGDAPAARVAEPLEPDEAEVYEALKLGLHDYVSKNRFGRVVIALSGGIDSALVAAVAVDALGSERVTCVSMPSPFSSEGTRADARQIAENLGAELIEIPIEPAMRAYQEILEPFAGAPGDPGLTEENLQARIRGNVVMALSNRFDWLVLTTGNKSELSVGYATLYGDMAGGFAVIKDCFKSLVYRLVRYRNGLDGQPAIPESVLERPPSAELRRDQRDEDSLPPYDVLDQILEAYVERDLGREEIVAQGLPADVVAEVIRMVDRSEYKRRQAPPGIKISTKAFGRDRRLPITNRFRG